MANNLYSSYSTNASQPDYNYTTPVGSGYENNNTLRASQVVATLSLPSRAVRLPLEELQTNFVLMAAEVDRLLILNSLMTKEAEQWKKKYLEMERSNPHKDAGDDPFNRQRNFELEDKLAAALKNSQRLEDLVRIKDQEIAQLRRGSPSRDNSDLYKEIDYWREKNIQTENDYVQKIQNIKAQTEGILREQIEREIKAALKNFDEEKRTLQNRINDLSRERDSLLKTVHEITEFRTKPSQEHDREAAYWKDKFYSLEASLDSTIRSTLESRLQETIAPILREKNALIDQLEVYKSRENERARMASPPRDYEDRINKLENEKRSLKDYVHDYEKRVNDLTRDNSSLADRLRDLEDKYFKSKESLRAKENEVEGLKQRSDATIRDLNAELDRTRRSVNQTSQAQYENENLARKLRELTNEANRNRMELENKIQNQEREKAEYASTLEVLKQKFRDLETNMKTLLEENEKLKYQVDNKDRELKGNEKYEKEAQNLRNQLRTLEEKTRDEKNDNMKRLRDLEDQTNKERNENTRMKDQIRQKDQELENWKQKYQTLERDTQNYVDKALHEAENHFRERFEREKQDQNARLASEKNAVERQLRSYEQQAADRERETARLNELNDQLKNRLDSTVRENNARIDEIRKKQEAEQKAFIDQQVHNYEHQIQHLTDQIKDFEVRQVLFFIEIERLYLINGEFIEEINRITKEINNLLAENERMQKQASISDGLREEVTDLEKRVQLLMNENARLSDTAMSRLKEINNLKQTLATAGQQNQALKRNQTTEPHDLHRLENERNNLEAQLNQMRQENKRLLDMNEQKKIELDSLYHDLQNSKNNNWGSKDLEAELRLEHQRHQQALKEAEEMKLARDFYKQQYEQLAKQKEPINRNTSLGNPQTSPTYYSTSKPTAGQPMKYK